MGKVPELEAGHWGHRVEVVLPCLLTSSCEWERI